MLVRNMGHAAISVWTQTKLGRLLQMREPNTPSFHPNSLSCLSSCDIWHLICLCWDFSRKSFLLSSNVRSLSVRCMSTIISNYQLHACELLHLLHLNSIERRLLVFLSLRIQLSPQLCAFLDGFFSLMLDRWTGFFGPSAAFHPSFTQMEKNLLPRGEDI